MTPLKTIGLMTYYLLLATLVITALVVVAIWFLETVTRPDYGIVIQRPGLTCCTVTTETAGEVGR